MGNTTTPPHNASRTKARSLNALLAENLASYMAERGFSAKELGRLCGLSPRTIGNYLIARPAITPTGKQRSAKLYEVELVAQQLGVLPLSLLVDSKAADQSVTADAMRVAKLFDSLDADQRAAVVTMVEAMQAPTGAKRKKPPAKPPIPAKRSAVVR